jgi:hypothetical protein
LIIADPSLRIDLSDLGHAAVDEELDASDVATFIGSEEGDHFGYFVQGSGATEGYFVRDGVGVFFDLFFGHAQGIAVARRITPGLTAFTRILRSLRSVVKVRAAALDAL